MRYSNVDYNVVYVDPSKTSSGDGTTPAKALMALPTSIASIPDKTCYIIRRTAEAKACQLPSGSSSSLVNLMLVGMPLASDAMWELVPNEAKTAWGSDSAQYANVQMATASGSFQMNYAQHFVLHRVYLFRDGVNADGYIFKFNNSSDYIGCFSFDHCKFGSRGINVDQTSYASEVTANRLCGYVYVYYARMLSITDCTINHCLSSYSSYGHGFYCRWADIINVENVRVFSPAWTYSSQAYPLFLSENTSDGVECRIRNVTQTIRLNGTSGQYVPTLLSVQGYISMTVENITVKTGTALSVNRPSTYQTAYPLLYFQNVYEVNAKGFDLEYRDCWKTPSAVLLFSRCYTSTYVPGIGKSIRDVKVTMAQENGIGANLTYANVTQSGNNNATVSFEFSSSTSYVYAKVVVVDGLKVINPRGKAFYAEAIRLTDAEFEGAVHLKSVIADIRSIKTWFPGSAISATEGTHARIRKLVCNIDNEVYPYNEDPAVGTTFSDNANVFVDEANTSLRPMTSLTSRAERVYQGFGCNNEGEDGHFAYRCGNGLCDTWSVHRQGGGASALKIYNNGCSNANTMVLGRRPFNGMQITPTTTGRHILRAYIAFKGYAKPAELYRHFIVSAETGGKVSYSTLHGRWSDDTTSVWVNDSELTRMVLEMPFDIPEVAPVDVRIIFSWYAGSGFVYLDPDIKLTEA